MKEEIRKEMLARRRGMDLTDSEWRDREIREHLRMCDAMVNAKRVVFYVPINNEVDATPLLHENMVQALLPFVKDGMMHAAIIESLDDVEPGMYGTMEPRKKIPEEHINVVLVPGLAFDRDGNRIGYGKGFYDRFLSLHRVFKIGLAYQFQIHEQLPVEQHDIPMDIIITEDGII